MRQMTRSSLSLGLAAGCAAALAIPQEAPAETLAITGAAGSGPALDVAALRAQGPAALDGLLARWDRLAPGPERDQLALAIDTVAAQRYATASRLYWFTDLSAAQAAARAQSRPILALRMLGRLDEDLSCANSRYFRTTLYANADVSRYLRDHFVLYWSSERAVPRITIDYGDGRKLERTTTGNSAHYVLDAAGRVVDVLPGLYAPAVFAAELGKSERLEQRLRGLPDAARTRALADHHRRELDAGHRRLASLANTPYVRARRLLSGTEVGASAVTRAQQSTMTKMVAEVPDLAKIGVDASATPADDIAAWSAIGQQVFGIFAKDAPARPRRAAPHLTTPPPAPIVLDAPSRALVAHVHNAGPVKASQPELDAMLARLEQSIVADTALNELRLRPAIRGLIAANAAASFAELNASIYSYVFHTPASDAWLGLLPRTDYTGLPGDGVVLP